MAWTNSVGISHVPTCRSTIVSEYSAMVLPDCSYVAQNGTVMAQTVMRHSTSHRWTLTCPKKDSECPEILLRSRSRSGGRRRRAHQPAT